LIPGLDFGPSPLVGRLDDDDESGRDYDSKFFNFPNFAVAPSTYVEKHKQQQLKQQQQEPQQQQKPESQFQQQLSTPTTPQSKERQVTKQSKPLQNKQRQAQPQQQQQPNSSQLKQQQRGPQQQQQQQQKPEEKQQLPEQDTFPPWKFFPYDSSDDNFYAKPG
jgi:hypothetical protein